MTTTPQPVDQKHVNPEWCAVRSVGTTLSQRTTSQRAPRKVWPTGSARGGLSTLTTAESHGDNECMNIAAGKGIRVITAVLSGAIALSGYAGGMGLLGGGMSFGEVIDARLPFRSLVLAGVALLMFVAAPMTAASVAAARGTRHAPDVIFGAGLLLVAWIAVELAFIKIYSWFHPSFLVAAALVLGLGWLMRRTAAPSVQPSGISADGTRVCGARYFTLERGAAYGAPEQSDRSARSDSPQSTHYPAPGGRRASIDADRDS